MMSLVVALDSLILFRHAPLMTKRGLTLAFDANDMGLTHDC